MMILPEGVVLTQATDMEAMKGQAATPPPRGSGRMFNRPTDIAIHPITGDLYISDGYGNNVRTVHLLCAMYKLTQRETFLFYLELWKPRRIVDRSQPPSEPSGCGRWFITYGAMGAM